MLDSIEAVMLWVLPWSFVAKTVALTVMWWRLDKQTTPTGPLGERINDAFGDQALMSAFITWVMFILSTETDGSEIEWPFVTLALTMLTLWPFRTAWSYYRVWRTYTDIARKKKAMVGP